MNNNYKVYMLVFPNKKVYIGMTSQKLNARWCNGKNYRRNNKMSADINNYGWDNIIKRMIKDNLSKEEAQDLERHLIKKFQADTEEFGYNKDPGGTGIGRISPMKGKKDTVRTRQKKSKAHEGEKAYWFNKQLPIEVRKKISVAHKGKKLGKDNPFAKEVYQFSLDGDLIKKWDCIEDAARNIKKSGSNITACCRGRQKSCGGYKWSYRNTLNRKRI